MSVFVDMDPILLGGVIFARDLQILTSVFLPLCRACGYISHSWPFHTVLIWKTSWNSHLRTLRTPQQHRQSIKRMHATDKLHWFVRKPVRMESVDSSLKIIRFRLMWENPATVMIQCKWIEFGAAWSYHADSPHIITRADPLERLTMKPDKVVHYTA